MNLLISSCLLGIRCRYDGGRKALDRLAVTQGLYSLFAVALVKDRHSFLDR